MECVLEMFGWSSGVYVIVESVDGGSVVWKLVLEVILNILECLLYGYGENGAG